MIYRVLCAISLCLLTVYSSVGQSNYTCKKISVHHSAELDSLTIFKNSVKTLPEVDFTFENNRITLKNTDLDSVMVCYRVFPFRVHNEFKIYDIAQKDTVQLVSSGYTNDVEVAEELFSSPGINKSGVLSRGISFGNRQDVFVNSNLNLQMQGELSDGIRLNASISDQNIPFQPEGNTQQIQEFDQIFITLDHKNWGINAGDILLRKQDSYFMKYFKKVQGAQFTLHSSSDTASSNFKTFASASVAKGKFNTMLIRSIEGVQGPYRLTGINGERFIIVIANTEKVFLDGIELKRGFDLDYTIDYNSSEITFNNNIVITKFSRIRVDFEYTERNYARSVYNFGHEQTKDNLTVGFNFFNEKDNKRQFLLGELPQEHKELLTSIGDSLQNAFVFSEDTAGPDDVGRVLYAKKDTLGMSIFQYSTASVEDSLLYTVVFTELSQGGDYIQKVTTVNGRVFEWVGQGNGTHSPIRIIPAPNKRQMMLINAEYQLGKQSKIVSEIAFSQRDPNLRSTINDGDNNGLGMRFGFTNQRIKLNNNLRLKAAVDYQYQGEQFNPLDRIRNVDFERDWNANIERRATENIANAQLTLLDSAGNRMGYKMSYRNKEGLINGLQHTAELKNSIAPFLTLYAKIFSMDNQTENQRAQWRRAWLNPEIRIKNKADLGYQFNMDKNRVQVGDSIIAPLMNFDEHVAYIKSGDSANGSLTIEHRFRQDYLPVNNELNWLNNVWNDKANTSRITYAGKIKDNHTFKLTSSYRNLITKDTSAQSQNENNILGRLDLNSNILSRHISSNLTYAVNTSRELVREVQYIPVLQSQGTHIWIDYNGDGIKDLDEFQERIDGVNVGSDTLYAKFFFPTNNYINAFTHNLNYRFNARAPSRWRSKRGLKLFLSRFNNTTFLVIDKKTTSTGLNDRLNPFGSALEFDGANAEVLSLRRNFRSTLFFNRTNPKYGLDLTRITQGGKQLLSYGQDGRYVKEWKLNSRFMLFNLLTLKVKASTSNKQSRSDYLSSREYEIYSNEISNTLAFQPNKSVRFSILYDIGFKDGIADTSRPTTFNNEIGFESKIRQLSKKTITASIKYVNIKFENGLENSPIGYDMLEALRPGNNFLWKFNIQQRLGNGLNVTFIYDGRKSGENPVIHTGSMQVSALF